MAATVRVTDMQCQWLQACCECLTEVFDLTHCPVVIWPERVPETLINDLI